MNEEMIRVTLGREELALLLRIFRATTLPGLEGNPMAGMTDEQAAAALVAAERSLRARGFIRVLEEEGRIEIDPVVMALVGSCLRPRFSLLVSKVRPESQPKARYYHVAPNLTVEHSSPEVGVHEFAGVADPAEMLPRIEGSLGLAGRAALACPSAHLRESALEQVRDKARAGEPEAGLSLLESEDVAADTAGALIESLCRPVSSTSFVRVDYGKPESEQVGGFSLLEGPNGLWALTPEARGDNGLWVDVEPIDTLTLAGRIRELLAS